MSELHERAKVIVCVFGRPASGKTSVIDRARALLNVAGVRAEYVTDHDYVISILIDPKANAVVAVDEDGAVGEDGTVVDGGRLDDVLEPVCAEARRRLDEADVVFVDLARASYCKSMDRMAELDFRPDLAIYLVTSLETALRRNIARGLGGGHTTPQRRMTGYYQADDLESLRARAGLRLVELSNETDGEQAMESTAETVAAAVMQVIMEQTPLQSSRDCDKNAPNAN